MWAEAPWHPWEAPPIENSKPLVLSQNLPLGVESLGDMRAVQEWAEILAGYYCVVNLLSLKVKRLSVGHKMLSVDLGQKVPKCWVEITEDGLLPCTFSLIWPHFITQFCCPADPSLQRQSITCAMLPISLRSLGAPVVISASAY